MVDINALAAMCQPDGALLPAGLLLAGLAGGVMHCAPMCGPFVLGQVGARLVHQPILVGQQCSGCTLNASRLAGALPGYHVGRIFTYMALGALAGTIGAVPGLGKLAGVALALAALLFFGQALRRLAPSLERRIPGIVQPPAAAIRLFGRLRGISGLPLGAALGLLPCGLLYGALLAASAAGSLVQGAAAMLLFGLGTVPALLAVGIAGQAATRRWQHALGQVAPVLLLVNSAALGIMAALVFAA